MLENAARCRNGNERAQPSGSSWRPSRVAARLYCSNKSYHPAITAPITSPRDEYILACSLSLFSPSNAPLRCSPLQYPAASARGTLYPRYRPLKLPLASFASPFPPCFASLSRYRQRARSFLVLSSTPRRNVLIRLTAFARHAFRLIPLLYRVTADRSHILGRRISNFETPRENQPAGQPFVIPDGRYKVSR